MGTTYLATQEGIYTLTASNDCGTKSDQLILTIDNRIPQLSLDDSLALCPGEPAILDVTQPFDAMYEWSTGSLLPTITITTPGTYTITVNSDCLEVIADITIQAKNDCEGSFYIPNVISPNGDNINDVFTIYPNTKVEIISIEGSIFDRWGNQVFHSNANSFTWDGKASGEEVNPGVFVYFLIVTYKVSGNEVQENITGDVTVLR